MRKCLLLLLLVFSVSIIWAGGSAEYPTKPIKLIVPYSAGGGSDTFARTVAKYSTLDQPFVPTNMSGGSGKIGTMETVNSKPDGYTLLIHMKAIVLGYYSGVYKTPIWEELEPICTITNEYNCISVKADSEIKSLEDLVKYAKKNPGTLKWGIAGIGGTTHATTAGFVDKAGIDIKLTPMDGGSQNRAALAGGHLDVITTQISEVVDLNTDGSLRIIGISGSKRHPMIPEVPTFKESGIDFTFDVWRCILGPKGMDPKVVKVLEDELEKITKNPDFVKQMNDMTFEINFKGSKEFKKLMEKEHEEYAFLEPLLK